MKVEYTNKDEHSILLAEYLDKEFYSFEANHPDSKHKLKLVKDCGKYLEENKENL